MRRLLFALAGALPLLAPGPGNAVRDLQLSARPGDVELLMLEAEGCAYCEVLRREVVALHRTATATRHVPIRFVDVSRIPHDSPLLAAPVTIVPTAVLLSEGREVARITGYAGAQAVLRLIRERAAPSG